jgi:hypothetical protein
VVSGNQNVLYFYPLAFLYPDYQLQVVFPVGVAFQPYLSSTKTFIQVKQVDFFQVSLELELVIWLARTAVYLVDYFNCADGFISLNFKSPYYLTRAFFN